MFHAIAKRYDTQLKGIPSVGDSLRDLQASFIAGCTPYLVLSGKGKLTLENGGLPPGTISYPDLATIVDKLLSEADDEFANTTR